MKALCKVPDGVALLYPDQRGGQGGVQDAALWAGGVRGVALSLRLQPGGPVESPQCPPRPSGCPHLQAAVTAAAVATDHHLEHPVQYTVPLAVLLLLLLFSLKKVQSERKRVKFSDDFFDFSLLRNY